MAEAHIWELNQMDVHNVFLDGDLHEVASRFLSR